MTGGVFARSAAKHCAEVVDEMGRVVPTQANGEVGVVDAGMAFDLQSRPEERDRRMAEWAKENV
jgi:hypothetical protein